MRPPRASEAGLTLVEVLMAMSITALATSVIVLSLPGRGDPLDQEMDKLRGQVEQSMSLALTSGLATGIDLQQRTYQTVIWTRDGWVPVPDTWRFMGNDVRISWTFPDSANGERSETDPEIVFDPGGIVEPLDIRFERRATRSRTLQVLPDGELLEGDGLG